MTATKNQVESPVNTAQKNQKFVSAFVNFQKEYLKILFEKMATSSQTMLQKMKIAKSAAEKRAAKEGLQKGVFVLMTEMFA